MNCQTPNPIRSLKTKSRTISCAIASALVASVLVQAQAASVAPSPLVVARATTIHAGDQVIGTLPTTAQIHLVVALRLRDQQGLDDFIASGSGSMPQATFRERHAPTPEQARTVADFLISRGLRGVTIAPDLMLVSANGRASDVAAAFGTTFVQVRTRDGRLAYANDDAVRIPAALAGTVQSVVGLQNVNVAHLFVQRGITGSGDPAVVPHDPDAFAAIYGGNGVTPASSVSVGIVADGSTGRAMADLASWTARRGLPSARVVNNGVADSATRPSLVGEGAAWNVASQALVGMAGSVRELDFHSVQDLSAASLLTAYDTIVSQDRARVIVLPFGRCEADAQADGSAAADDGLFAAAAAQGQSFVAAGGAESASCAGSAWPAASRYVVAVSGTRVATSPGTASWASESSWSAGDARASGFEIAAPWQLSSSAGRRPVSDVAYPGDPASGSRILVDGTKALFGGTGLSAALFAGTWSRVLQAHPDVGFAGPYLLSRPSTDFHSFASADPAFSGRGSPIIDSLLASARVQTNQPPTAAFTFTSSGLTAHFADASTDSDGTVVTHKWTFGDSGTATNVNPNHTYATAGTYSVTETVKDDGGATDALTQSVTVPFSQQLVGNNGFESAKPNPWNVNNGLDVIVTDPSGAHAGSKYALFGKPHEIQVLSQRIVVPAGMHSATLSFYLRETTNEIPTELQKDYLNVSVGTSLVAAYTAADANGGYAQKVIALSSSVIGTTVTLNFNSHESPSGNASTTWAIDDVRLTVR